MTDLKYHSGLRITEDKPEWNPQLPFELKLEFELGNLDISLVNGLRRVCLAEVTCVSVGPDIDLDLNKNATVFNSQYLKNRFSLQPIHLDNLEELARFGEPNNLFFKVADPNDHTQPLVNRENKDKHITTGDLIVLERISEDGVGAGEAAREAAGEAAVPAANDGTDAPAPAFTPSLTPAEKEKDINSAEAAAEFEAQAAAQEDLIAGEEAKFPDTEGLVGLGDQEASQAKYRRLDSKEFFVFQETYLATLKRGEYLYTIMKPKIGISKDHARWQAGLITYRFKPRKADTIDNPEYWNDDYNPIKDRQDYPREETIPGQYGTPERFELSIEYNGHYRPALVWLASIQTLHKKITNFLEQVRQINGENGKVTETLSVQFSPREMIPNLVTLTVIDEDHTLGNIVFSHYLYALQELVQSVSGNKYSEDILKGFSHYRVPHPLDNKLVIMLRVPDWPQDKLFKGFKNILRAGENPYDDAFYQNAPSIRLLMIVLHRVLSILNELEAEARNVLKMVQDNQIDVDKPGTKLPQAPLKVTGSEAELQEYLADLQEEKEELVGEEEEAKEDMLVEEEHALLEGKA